MNVIIWNLRKLRSNEQFNKQSKALRDFLCLHILQKKSVLIIIVIIR